MASIAEDLEELRKALEAVSKEHDELVAERDNAQKRAEMAESARIEIERQFEELKRASIDGSETDEASGSVRLRFNFPAPVKTACEQYLLYFSEFLRDIGVDSTTSLREDAGQVLFEVTPLNRDDALYRVREALELYLRLPSTPIDETNSSDIAVHKLAANVFHLKSQLALSAAIVRSQQVSIEAQAITIQMQRDVLEGKLISAATSASDEEAIFGGIVDVLPVEGKGVRINLPQLLRRMREWFQK